MKLLVFTVFDSKAECYMQPFFMPTQGAATRAFQDSVNKEGHQFSQHSEDYTLFQVGEYDDATGEITPLQAHISLGNAVQFLTKA